MSYPSGQDWYHSLTDDPTIRVGPVCLRWGECNSSSAGHARNDDIQLLQPFGPPSTEIITHACAEGFGKRGSLVLRAVIDVQFTWLELRQSVASGARRASRAEDEGLADGGVVVARGEGAADLHVTSSHVKLRDVMPSYAKLRDVMPS